ncbi:MAG: YeeE/YedE family protein [Rhodocyclales bacterium]|nr:YeeE/YedE family protein [Rhodocyclales bacterium]
MVGVLAIVSAWLTTILMGKTLYLGASTTFVRAAGMLIGSVDPSYVADNAYYIKEKVIIDWQFMMIVGIFIGAFMSSKMDGSYKLEAVPPEWEARFGGSVAKRAIASILGGIVMMMGARMADGCPSGHGLSGMMQMSVSSYVALAFFFGFGAIVANLMYRSK